MTFYDQLNEKVFQIEDILSAIDLALDEAVCTFSLRGPIPISESTNHAEPQDDASMTIVKLANAVNHCAEVLKQIRKVNSFLVKSDNEDDDHADLDLN